MKQIYIWEPPILWKICSDQATRRCVPSGEVDNILMAYHSSVCGGHLCAKKTSRKILHAGFYRPQLFKDCHELCNACDRCQRFGGLTKRHGMPQHATPSCEVLEVWAVDFTGPLPPSSGHTYTLPAVEYHSGWVEATPTRKDDAVTVSRFLRPQGSACQGVQREIKALVSVTRF